MSSDEWPEAAIIRNLRFKQYWGKINYWVHRLKINNEDHWCYIL